MAEVRILLVTHDPAVAELQKTLFARSNFRVGGTSSGVEAFNKAKFEHPDLALIDIALRDVAGDEVCADIKADPQTAGTFVVILLDEDDDWFAKRARDAGADHVLVKPVSGDEIERIIGKILRTPIRMAMRVPVRMLVEGAGEMGEMRGESVDISATGVQLVMKTCNLEKGYKLWLKFQVAPDSAPIVAKGEVVRVMAVAGEYHVGIHFTAFNDNGSTVLRGFLRSQNAI